MGKTNTIVPRERIVNLILWLRGHKVMIDSDLAALYGVSTRRLNEQVKRNKQRFPSDFMFQLTKKEKEQVVANCDHLQNLKFSPVLPYAFTEHGSVMAASVLNSERAVAVSIYVVRAFVKLRNTLAAHKDLVRKLEQIEKKLQTHDKQIAALYAIQQLLSAADREPKAPIGYLTEAKGHEQRAKKTKARKKTKSKKSSSNKTTK
jgi:hypothetical protein